MTFSLKSTGSGAAMGPDSLGAAFARQALRLPALPRPMAAQPGLTLGFGLILFALYVALGQTLLADPDTMWHIASGRAILETGHFPTADVWSYTVAGTPWIAKEWLSQILLALAYGMGGWLGVVVSVAAAAALAHALVFGELARRLDPLVALLLTCVIAFACLPAMAARPLVFAWAPMVAWSIALLRAAEAGRAPALATVALMTLWANLHGSFIFGFALIVPFGAESFLRADPPARLAVASRWAVFTVVALLACLIHAYGVHGLLAAVQVIDVGPSLSLIGEWKPQDFSTLGHFEVLLLGGVGLVLMTGVRLPAPRVALVVLLLHMALSHVRHEPLLAMVGALVFAAPLGERFGVSAMPADIRRWVRRAPLAGALVAAVAIGAGAAKGNFRPGDQVAPVAALAAARQAGLSGHVFNHYNFGGYLISQGVQTYIDGRTELFGARRLEDYQAALKRPDDAAMTKMVADNDIRWTILKPDSPATAWFDRAPGWRRVYADDFAVVQARVPAAN